MLMKKNLLENTIVVCLLACICCFLWGSAFPCIKIGYTLFSIPAGAYTSQILFAGIRFTFAGILVILFGSLLAKKPLLPKRSSWKIIIKISLFQTILQYLFFYIGMAHASGVKASIVEAANVFLAIIIANLVFHQESLTASKLLGCAVGFAGVVLINLTKGSLGGSMSFLGEGFILISAACYAISSGLLKKHGQDENPVIISGFQFFIGGIVMMLVGFLGGGTMMPVSLAAYPMMLYMALISAVAYTLWGILLKFNPVSKVAIFGFMNPVFGVILSALLLNEAGTVPIHQAAISLILVCIGIYIVNR